MAVLAIGAVVALKIRSWRQLNELKELAASGSPLTSGQVRQLVLSGSRTGPLADSSFSYFLGNRIPEGEMGRLLEVSSKLGQMERLLLTDRLLLLSPADGGARSFADFRSYIKSTSPFETPRAGFDLVDAYDGFLPRAGPLQLDELPILAQYARGEITWPEAVRTIHEQVEQLRYEVDKLSGPVSDPIASWVFSVFQQSPLTGDSLVLPTSTFWVEYQPTELTHEVVTTAITARAKWFPGAQNIDDLTLARLDWVSALADQLEQTELVSAACERIGEQCLGWTKAQWQVWSDGVLRNPADPLYARLARQTGKDWTLATDSIVFGLWSGESEMTWLSLRRGNIELEAIRRVSLRILVQNITPRERDLLTQFVKVSI